MVWILKRKRTRVKEWEHKSPSEIPMPPAKTFGVQKKGNMGKRDKGKGNREKRGGMSPPEIPPPPAKTYGAKKKGHGKKGQGKREWGKGGG